MNLAAQRIANPRIVEVDALRGLAALSVVFFHYTTRFVQLYGSGLQPSWSFPYGFYGVNLFFILSGFVIFMTLERTRRPVDFLVSRFSRLFPAFWAAVILTFSITSMFGLPGKEVDPLTAALNLTMIHAIFQVRHVDGVYWTLEVELLFYAGMLGLFALRRLHQVDSAIWLLLTLRLTWHIAETVFGVSLSWTLSRLLILPYIPWFALGIGVYRIVSAAEHGQMRSNRISLAASLACLGLVDGWQIAALAVALASVVWAAASSRLPLLGHPVLAFFGAISYTLYLLHENIGWVVQRAVQDMTQSFDASVVAAFAMSVMLATLLTYAIERPAMKAIRSWHRARQPKLPVGA